MPEYSLEFEKWWHHYLKKTNKYETFKAYQKALKEISSEELLTILITQKENGRWSGREKRYIEAGSVWLNKKRWEDEEPIQGGMPFQEDEARTEGSELFGDMIGHEKNEKQKSKLQALQKMYHSGLRTNQPPTRVIVGAYMEYLNQFSQHTLEETVDKIISEEEFVPTISRFKRIAYEVSRATKIKDNAFNSFNGKPTERSEEDEAVARASIADVRKILSSK